MTEDKSTIEVEVVEIDGVSAPANTQNRSREADREAAGPTWQQWQKWPGRVRQLDPKWMPLWIILGIIAVFLILTVGVVVGLIFLVLRIIRNILLGFLSFFAPTQTGPLRPR